MNCKHLDRSTNVRYVKILKTQENIQMLYRNKNIIQLNKFRQNKNQWLIKNLNKKNHMYIKTKMQGTKRVKWDVVHCNTVS